MIENQVGSCHCGAVRFEADSAIVTVKRCRTGNLGFSHRTHHRLGSIENPLFDPKAVR